MSDHADFERLVAAHLSAGYNLARWLVQDAHDAEDVVQEACLRALKYIAAVRGNDARAWFLTIVSRSFYDWPARHRPAMVLRDDDAVLDALADTAEGPEQLLERKTQARALADMVAALPLVYREVIVLRELEELSYKEIARIADVPIGTVMSRLARARRRLQASAKLRAPGRTAGSKP